MPKIDLAARFWEKVDRRGPDECWPWTASFGTNGYGQIGVGSRPLRAHRVSFELHFGAIPPGLLVCHRCDNPPCVNPAHLFTGTSRDNTLDMQTKNRGSGQGGRGSANCNSRLTAKSVREIRRLVALGFSSRAIAAQIGTTKSSVVWVKTGRSWAWLDSAA